MKKLPSARLYIENEFADMIRVSPVPEKNLSMLHDAGGARSECVGSFPERFKQAYLSEMQAFVDCALTGRKAEVTV